MEIGLSLLSILYRTIAEEEKEEKKRKREEEKKRKKEEQQSCRLWDSIWDGICRFYLLIIFFPKFVYGHGQRYRL